MVTLRRERMWEFLDRLVNVALPRVRDFRGVSPRGFDGRGNYTMGVTEQIIFPEIEYDKIDTIKGMNIIIVTTARDRRPRVARCSTHLGMPFRQATPTTAPTAQELPHEQADRYASQEAEVQGSHQEPLQALRPFARVHPQVRDVPLCFRELALRGDIPGVIKSSW